MRWMIAGVLVVFSGGGAFAQGFCATDTGHVPPCMVGDWFGESNAHELLDFYFSLLPEEVRATVLPPIGTGEFLRITDDGWWAHMAVPAEATLEFRDGGEWSEPLDLRFDLDPTTGFFTALSDGTLKSCVLEGSGGFLTMSGGETTVGQAIPEDGSPGADVPIRWSCGSGGLRIATELPGGMGTLVTEFERVGFFEDLTTLPEHP